MPKGRGTSGRSRGTRILRAVGNAYTNDGVLQTIGRSENELKNSIGPGNLHAPNVAGSEQRGDLPL